MHRKLCQTQNCTCELPHLDEADVSGLLTEALAADVQAILADDSVAVAAHAAAGTVCTEGTPCQLHGHACCIPANARAVTTSRPRLSRLCCCERPHVAPLPRLHGTHVPATTYHWREPGP